MVGFQTQEVERKVLSILKVLSDSQEPLGARVIARQLKHLGVELGERAVRYHLKLMNEWGIPTVYIECLLYEYLSRLEKKGAFIPSCAIAGGFALEDQVFKAIALGSPYVKAVCLGRATLTASMVGKANAEKIMKEQGEGKGYEEALMHTFANVAQLKNRYGKDFEKIPPSAIGMYNYYARLTTGLQQLMAGARKFRLDLIERNDLMSLTREAAEISGISYVMDADREEVDRILS